MLFVETGECYQKRSFRYADLTAPDSVNYSCGLAQSDFCRVNRFSMAWRERKKGSPSFRWLVWNAV